MRYEKRNYALDEKIFPRSRRAQVSAFIILAIIIVAAVAGYFIYRETIKTKAVPAEFEPVYNSFLTCMEDDVSRGISVLELQGGYIDLPDFEPGSNYMPFSSQLDFLGVDIPYWYFISGNNIEEEQVPSKKQMEQQLEEFIESDFDCDFNDYYEQGFEIIYKQPKANVNIKDEKVKVDLDMSFSVAKGEESIIVKSHNVEVNSLLGQLYDSAKKVYEKEQEDLFLENYGVDILNLYAPVTGVDISCSPKAWLADNVFEDLKDFIEVNTLALRTHGEGDDYFNVDVPVSSDINVDFVNSENWANSFEVAPTDGNVMMAEPVGNQPGLGVLGFCYVPYHFVYNVKYPVLIRLSKGNEVFQFPVAVIIQGNQPREKLDADAVVSETPDICKDKNTFVTVNIYDSNMNFVDANISYKCLGIKCSIGQTQGGKLRAEFPQCVNGYILADAPGFEEAEYIFSVLQDSSASIVLNKLYEMNIDLDLENQNYNGGALITFTSGENSKTILYPEQKSVELTEGEYDVEVKIYEDSSIKLGEVTKNQCIDVPVLGGIFGLEKEKCFEIEVPEQIISNALSGGGSVNYYFSESELKNSGTIKINAKSLPQPDSIEQLQDNYLLLEDKDLGVSFE